MQFRALLMLLPLVMAVPIGCQPNPPASVAQPAAQSIAQPEPVAQPVVAPPTSLPSGSEQRLNIPAQSPFHNPQSFARRGAALKLEGQMWVQGTLTAKWRGSADRGDRVVDWELLPDRPDQLPQFKTHQYQKIDITRTDRLPPMAFGPEIGQQIASQELPSAEIKGKFLIRDLQVGITCDTAWARATVQQVDIPAHVAAQPLTDRKMMGC
jgi:hypothetical protein